LVRRLVGPQSPCGFGVEEKESLLLPVFQAEMNLSPPKKI
jgi:hypothetical protein